MRNSGRYRESDRTQRSSLHSHQATRCSEGCETRKTGRTEMRKDFGLLAYNDIPSYEVIDEGITSLSIDWEMMGNEAANFVLNNVPIQKYLPTEVRLRKSL